ncbi:iron-siderophore ABC transporter permease [Alicycliphilus denitrificans]|uniref:FecCD family ABC transporter permease n=1 Tax=Alicycliphilus denitrificans TaxID=179636 RepID=UPI00095F6FBF|nr:iron ABC transporter permease [Alicycliphilus denitrificans]MBN9575399.1 iron ABC transporter permease [Alicycliphilus denitrificans]OJW82797.1 MAG: iron ABC transporter permease [Alicycliphilus sp. 69-12]BCN38421.1 iron-siderophore ABC transporter permease [Alicycliphilus denitrificans]
MKQPESAVAHYQRRRRRRLALLAALALALIASVALDVATGPSGMAVERLLQILRDPGSVPRVEAVIVWNVRLPYALMAVLVGAALALAGVEMQTVLDNPLASPFTLGVSAAAALGAALAIVLGLALPGVPPAYVVAANAFVFALASVALLYLLALWRGFGVESLVLFGIALVFSFNALVALLQFVASQDTLQQLVFWTLGSLARASWDKLAILAAVLALCLPLAWRQSWAMTALTLGEDRARSFGVPVGRLRAAALLRISLLSGVAVAFVGTIGFVGLVAPHIARMLVGEDHRVLLPASALAGALILSMASVASKTLIDGVLVPVGIVTSLVGIPFFLAIVARTRKASA